MTTMVVISRDHTTSPADTPIPTAIANGWVAFAASRSDSDSGDIYLVREGSDPRRITGSDTDATDEICPAFSPDASQLLFGRAAGINAKRAITMLPSSSPTWPLMASCPKRPRFPWTGMPRRRVGSGRPMADGWRSGSTRP